jgi:hypothetical protein
MKVFFYGLFMDEQLLGYADDSVADYLPETLTVELLAVTTRLGFPEPYLAHIRQAANL